MTTTLPERLFKGGGGDDRDPLLAASFEVPQRPRNYVDRPRLTSCLNRGTAFPLTLVSAPAGSGKTSAVAGWVRSRLIGRPEAGAIGWVSIEAGGDGPNMSWASVVECLHGCGVTLPQELPARSRSERRRMLRILAAALAELRRPLTLVLDSYDAADAELDEGMEFLVGHSGSRLRLVIVARSDPALPLHRFRLYDAIAEVRMADLAFSERETDEFVHAAGIQLRPDSVRALAKRTRGWAAGLRFASIALERCFKPDLAVARLAGDTGNIAEYLLSEVLNTQPRDVRDVLLRTSVVEVLRPGLIEELGGRFAARTLSGLVCANVLVEELPEAPGWYRYNPLFRELLCAELARSSVSRLTRLQRRATTWYSLQGMVAELPTPWNGPIAPVVVAAPEPTPPAAHAAPRPTLHVVTEGPASSVPPSGARFESSVGSVIEPLTAKELEVLGHIAEMLSTEEIATTLFVSVNTVRTHIRNILRKLAVNRRNEAVRRARALSLLDA